MQMGKRVVVLLSGGLDSVTLAYHLQAEGYDVRALTVYYGQRHAREIQAAMRTASTLGMPWHQVQINGWAGLLPGNVLTGDADSGNPVVPNRNAVLLSLAASVAVGQGADSVAFAANAADYAQFPDCRLDFVLGLETALGLGNAGPRHPLLRVPFVDLTKAEIVCYGAELGVPFAQTWSCYGAGPLHCGACLACAVRRAAFTEAGVPDPTQYAEEAVCSG